MAKIVRLYGASIQDSFYRRLTRDRWEVIGRGCFGVAFAKGLLVWKVEYGADRSGWRAFIQRVANGELSGRHFPKVKLVLVFEDGVAALMERFTKDLDHVCDWLQIAVLRAFLERTEYSFFEAERLIRISGKNPKEFVRSVLSEFPLELRRLGHKLKALAVDTRHYLDIKGDNLMFRRDGTVVVVDPISGYHGKEL